MFLFLLDLLLLYISGNTTMDLWAAKLVVESGGTNYVASINFLFGSVDITPENLTPWTWISTAITVWFLWEVCKSLHCFWCWCTSTPAEEGVAKKNVAT